VTVLIKKGKRIVRAQQEFARAVLLEADGTPSTNRRVKRARGITRWRFVFDNQTPNSQYASVFLTYARRHFGEVVGNPDPWLEDARIPKAPKMTLRRAVRKLRAAGYRRGFRDVTLRQPIHPGVNEPSYIFGFGRKAKNPFVAVGTKTGKVKPIA
jgi:hypothetical protein